ncbi:zinc finger protein 318 [Hypanus sabinus]|uniref:zinc finger protein 318 n=1 Tax=Hypanus sabinus TaxID=79690 RepID=UPI0028C43B46|nr:zinc finger protein 318 [Hypanus sabinus]XP_059838570.1 zinc finger protein 318 [Hypanus sabinus]XP_059838572.1 zinc finger protein 318 [Hypanus sabinus]XP_059838573.1 zinc finger protein 318 [Hypanus sabinus]XP_059838574.1 zinc finger protein 318 [Hypanus sabinus]
MGDGLMYRSPLPQSSRMQGKHSLRDDYSREFLGMMPADDTYKRRSDYGSRSLSQREGRRSSERDVDRFRKIPYSHLRSDDRGRDSKRSQLEHRSRSRDRHSREHRSRSPERHRNYRTRSPDRPQNLTPHRNPASSHAQEHFSYSKSKNDEFRELEIARRRKEQEERIIAEMLPPSQRELSNSSYRLSERFEKGTSSLQQSPRSGYILHRPDEAPQMPKKSILKKRTEPELESSAAMQFDEYCGVTVNEKAERRDSYSPSQSFMRLPQKELNFPESEQFSFMRDNREMHRITEQVGLSGLTNTNFHFERELPAKYTTKSELEISSENKICGANFLLPHEQASQGNSGFSRIIGLLAEVDNNFQERKHNFPNIDDEERFLYGDLEEDKTGSRKFRPSYSFNNLLPLRQTNLPEGLSNTEMGKTDKEYEKIHDLLKTIGLDIGVSEISKLAARTQERLHGKKSSTQSPDSPLDSHNSVSWDKLRTRNDTKSLEPHLQSRMKLSKQENTPHPGLKESKESFRRDTDVKAKEPERAAPLYPAPTNSINCKSGLLPTPSSAFVMPPYGQFALPPINYPLNPPPLAFNQYNPYLAYTTPAWPRYPPPQVSEPSSPVVVMMPQSKVSRPNLRVIETVNNPTQTVDQKREESVLVRVQTTLTPTQTPESSSNRLMSKSTEEDKRKAEQKRKVLEEKAKLQKEKESRQKRLDYLGNELQKLSKQQGELLRKKRREKDGHKDPLLVENGKLQEDIVRQMSIVRQQVEDTEKKLSELDKVAQILGVVIQEKTSKLHDLNKDDALEKVLLKGETLPSSEEISTRKGSQKELDDTTEKLCESFSEAGDVYEYYDAGNHWCKNCNTICGTLFDFFTHMHNKRHRQTLDPYDRPWSAKMLIEDKNDSIKRTDKIAMPAKGSEFLMPVTGFYCQLCEKFYGDQICAEDHVKSHAHNDKYKEYLNENPVYEQRRNLDRQAGLVVIMETERRRQGGLKRKMDEDKEVQKQKNLEEGDEKKAKQMKLDVDECESVTELEEERSDRSSSHKIEPSSKPGIKLLLKKDEIEDKKDEEQGSSFGKFSWKKSEKEEEKSSLLGTKEEHAEGSKEKDDGKGQGAKSAAKTIEIKLSGKTLIAHTSPWVPFTSVSTTTQAKIRPNLPVANVPQRKGSITTVNKPAPLDTFLSIRSSGASNKPLPVVKSGMLLAPEVISRAFGGEEVTLKGSVLDVHREPDPLAEEPAPGVSECEQTILAIPVRPPPISLSDSSKKMEKPKSCLAAANAKDLYGIYYSSSGKSPADCRLGSSAQNTKLVHGTLKSVPSYVKIGDVSSSKELVPSENTALGIPKAVATVKLNITETDEQTGSHCIPDVQSTLLCEDDILSNSVTELQNKSDEETIVQHDVSAKKVVMGTVDQGGNNFTILNLAEDIKELDNSALRTMVEQPPQCDGTKEVENVDLHSPILKASVEQSQSINNVVEHVEEMGAEECQESDLSTSNTLEVKSMELIEEQLQTTETYRCGLTGREADVASTVRVANTLSDGQSISNVAEQVGDEVGSLGRAVKCPNQCDANLNFPVPTKEDQDLKMDLEVSDSTTDSRRKPVEVKVEEMDSSELEFSADQSEEHYTGPILSQPADDVKMDVPVLDSTGDQLEQSETGINFSKPVDEDTDVKPGPFALNNANKQPNRCDPVLSFSKPIEEVKDVKVATPVLDTTVDHLEQCDISISFSDRVDEVKDVEVSVPVLDSTADQLGQCDTALSYSDAMDDIKGMEVGALVSDRTANLPVHCEVGIKFSEPMDEVEDIKVDAYILENNAEPHTDADFSILNPVGEAGDLEVNAPLLHSTVEQQQHLDEVEQVRAEGEDGNSEKLIRSGQMCSSFQTDLCPILDQQEALRIKSCSDAEVGTHLTEERDTSVSSSLQTEQVGKSEQRVINPEEQCKNKSRSQQPKLKTELRASDRQPDQDESSSPEHLKSSDVINILDETKCTGEREVSTLNSAVQTADSSGQLPLQNINVSSSERAGKESSMPVVTQSVEVVDTQEEYKITGSSRTSRRAAQAGKATLCVQTPDKSAEKPESNEHGKQLRRRSARNLRSPK